MTTKLVYLLGKPGVGKYTIAKEMSGYLICDNQLINSTIFSLINLKRGAIPGFAWESIDKIRDAVLDFISVERCNDYVLTNNLYNNDFDRKIYKQVLRTALKRDSTFVPVRLYLDPNEHQKRIQEEERKARYKSTKLRDMHLDSEMLPVDHNSLLDLDITNLSAKEAAAIIMKHVDDLG